MATVRRDPFESHFSTIQEREPKKKLQTPYTKKMYKNPQRSSSTAVELSKATPQDKKKVVDLFWHRRLHSAETESDRVDPPVTISHQPTKLSHKMPESTRGICDRLRSDSGRPSFEPLCSSCLTTLRTDLASAHNYFPNLAVTVLARATAPLPSSASASCLATPRQALTIAFLVASFCSLNAPQVGLARKSMRAKLLPGVVSHPWVLRRWSPHREDCLESLVGQRRHCILDLVLRPRRRRCRGSSPSLASFVKMAARSKFIRLALS